MSNFQTLGAAVATIAATGPKGAAVKGLTRGEAVMAGVLRCGDIAIGLHQQPDHVEILVVLEGAARFQVGGEVRDVCAGDYIFIPRNALHGTVAVNQSPLSFLSIMTPLIDLSSQVVWQEQPSPVEMIE